MKKIDTAVATLLNQILGIFGVQFVRARPKTTREIYNQDGLRTIHNHDFMYEQDFLQAYGRGVQAAGEDYHIHWRVHVAIWCARRAEGVRGDFVECGVNRGFVSSAIMEALDWKSQPRAFYLLDTFEGIDLGYTTSEERVAGIEEHNAEQLARGFYTTEVEGVKKNFSEWCNAVVIQGSVPETLSRVLSEQIAFVHLDMNSAMPERAAAEFFWPRMVGGSILLMDDYAFRGYEEQKRALDEFAASVGTRILALPTGQGLAIK